MNAKSNDQAIAKFHDEMYKRLDDIKSMSYPDRVSVLSVCIELNRVRTLLTIDKSRTKAEKERAMTKPKLETLHPKRVEHIRKFMANTKRNWTEFTPIHYRTIVMGLMVDFWPTTRKARFNGVTYKGVDNVDQFIEWLEKKGL